MPNLASPIAALTQNVLEFGDVSLAEITRCYRQHISADLVRLLRLTGFGALEMATEGSWIIDENGRRYLDYSGGYGVFSLGHRHPQVVAAVKDQLDKVPLSSRVFLNPMQAKLAEKLAEITPAGLQYSFFSNSGAEAIEAALKMARLATGRGQFVSTIGAYHGKTFGSLSVSGRDNYKTPFAPLLAGCHTVPFGDLNALDAALTPDVAGFLLEPIQGEGGIHVASDAYLQGARRLCSERGVLLIADEVQSGLCRSGHWFAIDKAGVAPDIMTLAKSLGGGVMPIAATIANAEAFAGYRGRPTLHSSTFGGNPLACRAALATLDVMASEQLCGQAASSGIWLKTELQKLATQFPSLITDVRGMGLMLGLEFADEQYAGALIFAMVKRNVIAVYTLNQPRVIRFEPPLNTSKNELLTAVRAVAESLDEVSRQLKNSERECHASSREENTG